MRHNALRSAIPLCALCAFPLTAHAQPATIPADALGIVPQPRHVVAYAATYTLPASVTVEAAPAAQGVAAFAVRFLQKRGITATIGSSPRAEIRFVLRPQPPAVPLDRTHGDGLESYDLNVTGQGITIAAQAPAGLFYGLQTLEQLFPVLPAAAQAWQPESNTIHQAAIDDAPRYRWRGIHLDVSRHFFGVPVVERYIDVAAHYKLNVFHWHLTDDQGWRIEIKRYPRLASVGGCRNGTQMGRGAVDGVRYCGYYTQDEIRQVVAYAAERFVTVVPEIEMPGHTMAALAAYPKLACEPGPYTVRETWGESGYDALCPTPYTFTFVKNVLDEVMSLFPSRYIHIGGDEVLHDAWRDSPYVHALMARLNLKDYEAVQSYFTRRIEELVRGKGRRMVGWDEIAKAGVSPDATVMVWHGNSVGAEAAAHGNDVVMAPDGPLYFDAYQGDRNDEPLAIGGLTTTQMVYDYDPEAGMSAPEAAHVLGVEGCAWTEFIPTASHLFYMVLPRELALSEIAWSPQSVRDWASFVSRSSNQYAWLEANEYNFRIPNPSFSTDVPMHYADVSSSVRTVDAMTSADTVTLSIHEPVRDAAVYYTTDGSLPTANSARYTGPLRLSLTGGEIFDITAVAILPSGRTSTPSEFTVRKE